LTKKGCLKDLRIDYFSLPANSTPCGEQLKQSKFGRPPLAPEDVRNNRVVTFVTQAELMQLQELTEQQNKSLSALYHHILSDYLQNNRSRSGRID